MKAIQGVELARPSWAKALIVAEYKVDKSDTMTDYHASTSTCVIALGWSKHTRDLFPELRTAAARFAPTAHLGPGRGRFHVRVVLESPESINTGGTMLYAGGRSPWHRELYDGDFSGPKFSTRAEAEAFTASKGEPCPMQFEEVRARFAWQIGQETVEHREKYSMGHGYYLKAGHRHDTGWEVHKESYRLPDTLEAPVDPLEPGREQPCVYAHGSSECLQPLHVHGNTQIAGGGQ